MALIDHLAGIPHTLGRTDKLVVPRHAWTFFWLHREPDFREWWQTGRPKYDGGLLFQIK